MANVFVANSAAGIIGGALGAFNGKKVNIQIDNVNIVTTGARKTIFYYGEELNLYIDSTTVFFQRGGTLSAIGDVVTNFGVATNTSPIIADLFELNLNIDGSFTFTLDGVVTRTGGAQTRNQASAGARLRIGCATNSGASNTAEVINPLITGSKIGDVRVVIDDVPVANYVMPSVANATVIPDSVNGQDATLEGGDGTDFEVITTGPAVTTRRVTFDIPAEIRALGSIRYFINKLSDGVQVATGTQDFATATQEFNLDAIEAVTDGLALSLTATDATGSNDNTAGVMFGTANAVVVTA